MKTSIVAAWLSGKKILEGRLREPLYGESNVENN